MLKKCFEIYIKFCNTIHGELCISFDKYSRCIFEMQRKVLKLAFSLQKALKTIISFVYHKSKTLHFTYIQKGSHLLKETAILPQNYIYLRKSL